MREHARILVLNTTKYGEKSLIVHCISDLWGRRSFMTSYGSRTSSGLYSPINILDCEVTPNTKSDLWRLSNASLSYPLISIRSSIPKTSISLFMSEVLYRAVRDGGQDDGIFAWCERAVLTLEGIEEDFVNYHIVFLLELAAALGFKPSAQDLAPYAGEHFAVLSEFLNLGTAEAMLLRLSGAQRAAICRAVISYLEYHTESRLDIRSLEVLHQLFN